MTFDLAQMIADREAGTPGEWACHFGSDTECQCKSVVGEHGGFGAIAIICSDNGKRIGDGGNDAPSEPEAKANARRIARVPFLEAEIIRLTARVAELEGALMDIRSHYTHDQSAFAGVVARAALSTHTEEPKT